MKVKHLALTFLAGLTLLVQACGLGVSTLPPVLPGTMQPSAQPETSVPSLPDATQGSQQVQPAQALDVPGGFLIQTLENTMLVTDANGQTTPFFPADRPFTSPVFQNYSSSRNIGSILYAVSVGEEGQSQVYTIDPNEIHPLEFTAGLFQGFAVWPGNESQPARLAWDQLIVNSADNTGTSRLMVGNVDGSGVRTLLEQAGLERALVVGRWSRDGQRLYFSKEPLGQGGYIPFSGASNLWAYNLADSSIAPVIEEASLACIDDLSYDEILLVHHCANPTISVIEIASGAVSTIEPPAGVEANYIGSARISPDGPRVAFAIARGDPDNEQGWVAVSDSLSGSARIIATSPPRDYFHVVGWLDADTLVLQSWGVTPGVWLVNTDGSGLLRMVDGIYHGLVNGG